MLIDCSYIPIMLCESNLFFISDQQQVLQLLQIVVNSCKYKYFDMRFLIDWDVKKLLKKQGLAQCAFFIKFCLFV